MTECNKGYIVTVHSTNNIAFYHNCPVCGKEYFYPVHTGDAYCERCHSFYWIKVVTEDEEKEFAALINGVK